MMKGSTPCGADCVPFISSAITEVLHDDKAK